MESHNAKIKKSVRYFTVGKISPQVKNLWICLHGYGQNAEIFARRFEKLDKEDRLFLVPEGPHRFYVTGTSGQVGSSWMTKVDRLNDISDQFEYLEELTGAISSGLIIDCNIHILGFSQGVATALRWIDRTAIKVKSLICWAGTFPPDVDYKLHHTQFEEINFHACFGDDDEFIPLEKAKELLKDLEKQEIKVQPHFFEGGHRMYDDLLGELIVHCETQ